MQPSPHKFLAMQSNAALEARLNMLSLAVECIGASLSGAKAHEVSASFNERLSLLLADRGQISDDVDAALAAQAGLLLQAFRR
jgi:hypothetical protein